MDLFNNNFLLVKDPKRLLRGVIYNIFVLEIFDQMQILAILTLKRFT